MSDDTAAGDFETFGGLKVPIKRAAYSDRTAWMMAILAELAYVRFDQDGDNDLYSIALDILRIAKSTGLELDGSNDSTEFPDPSREKVDGAFRAKIDSLLEQHFSKMTEDKESTENKLLKGLLELGGWNLKGVVFDKKTDTQGYIAINRSETEADELGMAVIVFRGTQQSIDWWTNLNATAIEINGRGTNSGIVVGKVHEGFNRAYQSVDSQIKDLLEGEENLPLYITGHSLGGALATLATWYLPGAKLAACYTFGAPRVGDQKLYDRYRTPIYRIVNGTDPVPFVPPSNTSVTIIKKSLRFLTIVFPGGGILERLTDKLVRIQGYRHYGDSRYLKICEPACDGTYPDLTVEPGITPFGRIARAVYGWSEGAWSQGARLEKYHNMAVYRRKLRYWAIKRQDNVI